MTEKGIMIEVT